MPNVTNEHSDTETMLVVAGALTDSASRVLVAQRPFAKEHGGLWEFPGGKVEPGETPESALVRELKEELGVILDPVDLEPFAFASEPRGRRHLILLLYRVARWQGEPRAIDAAAIRWMAPDELAGLAMPPADIPLASALAADRRGE